MRRWIVFSLLFIGLPGLLLLTMAGARALEQQPTFCASCHEERINYETWLRSGAARDHPTCIECHSAPGLYGALNAQARGAVHVVKHVTGQFTEPLRGSVPQEWCMKCHTADARLQQEHHEVPRFATASCAECHNHRPGARFKGEEEGERSGEAHENREPGDDEE
jgi:nitrate/TMAO reductase-like tetraheme cytochrome c subunit